MRQSRKYNSELMIRYHSTGHMALTFRKTVRVIVTKTSAWFFISYLRQTTLRDHTRVASFTKKVIKEESNGKVKFSFVEDNIGYTFGLAWNLWMFCGVAINSKEEFVQTTKKGPKIKRGAQCNETC